MLKFIAKALSPLLKSKKAGKKRKKKRAAEPSINIGPETVSAMANEMVDSISGLTAELGTKAPAKKAPKKSKKKAAKKIADGDPSTTSDPPNKEMTSERKKIIEHALSVQRAKAHIFNDLKDEEKKKLYALAVKTLLRSDDDK